MKPTFFASLAEFRKWLKANHAKAGELLVGFYKVGSGKPSMTWPESVDEALCFGWIDGVRKSLGPKNYTIRFTPRRPGTFWGKKNIARAQRLIKEGRMQPAGLKAFESRLGEKSGAYSFEQTEIVFEPALEKRFKANRRLGRSSPPSRPAIKKPCATGNERQAGSDAIEAAGAPN